MTNDLLKAVDAVLAAAETDPYLTADLSNAISDLRDVHTHEPPVQLHCKNNCGRFMELTCPVCGTSEKPEPASREPREGRMEGMVYDCIEKRLGLTHDPFSSRPRYLFIVDAIDLLMQQARQSSAPSETASRELRVHLAAHGVNPFSELVPYVDDQVQIGARPDLQSVPK